MKPNILTPWDDPAFVSAWNETYGIDMRNAPIRPGVVYPWIHKLVKDFSGKRLIDIGCGNGNLIRHFRDASFKEWHGIDTGREVIKSAQENVPHSRVTFTHIDPDQSFPFEKTGRDYDVATAIFVLEEIPNPAFPQLCRNVADILKKGGMALIFSTHPFNIVLEDSLRTANMDHPEGIDGYFDSKPSSYSLSDLNGANGVEKKLPYHHKTMSTILNGFLHAGLCLRETMEIPFDVTGIAQMEDRTPKKSDVPGFIALNFMKPD